MKLRIAVVVVLSLAAVIIGVGWHQHRSMEDLRQQQAVAKTELRRLGVDPDAGLAGRVTKRLRDTKASANAANLDEAMRLYREIAAAKTNQLPKDRETALWRALRKQLRGLSPAQLRGFAHELAKVDCSPENRGIRNSCIKQAIDILAASNRAEALDLKLGMVDCDVIPKDDRVLFHDLHEWNKEDPKATLDWMLQNIDAHGDLIHWQVRGIVLRAVAGKDRSLALSLIDDLKIKPYQGAQIFIALTPPAERMSALKELREFLPSIKDSKERFDARRYAMGVLGTHVARDGFENATRWIEEAGLTQSEFPSFYQDISGGVREGEQGLWVDWLGANNNYAWFQSCSTQIIHSWTEADYKAAGEWIGSHAPGPVRDFAVSVYAGDLAKREPEAAARWAVTLPEGELREKTLHRVARNWPRNTPEQKAAAEAFDREHGMDHSH